MGTEESGFLPVARSSSKDAGAAAAAEAVICTMADAGFYLGLVALLNSLHLTGHGDLPIVVLDGGLTPEQRRSIEPFATVKPLPPHARVGSPLAKVELASLALGGVVFFIDADCIVTGSLLGIVTSAASGRICAARDDAPLGSERRFSEWEWLFGLRSSVRRRGTYVNAGAVCVSTDHWPDLLRRWADATRRLPPGPYFLGRPDSPLDKADQDVLNAILMSEVPASALEVLPMGTMAYAQWRDARVLDLEALAVTAEGRASTVVHFSLWPKPWSPGGWRRVGREPLLPLVGRCLLGDGLVVRPNPSSVPWWLKPGRVADALRVGVGARNHVSHAVLGALWDGYDALPGWCRVRLRRIRGRRGADFPVSEIGMPHGPRVRP